MNKINKFRMTVLIIIILLLIVLSFKITIWNNPIKLITLSQSFDEPSILFHIIIERVYKLSEEKDTAEKFIELIENEKSIGLKYRYIRVLGVIGDNKAVSSLKQAFDKYSNNDKYPIMVHYIIGSMGLIGDEKLVPFLEELLKNYKQKDVYISGVMVAGALYLLTGSTDYRFEGAVTGNMISFSPSKEDLEARSVIIESKGRKRTYEEMIILDKVYRP